MRTFNRRSFLQSVKALTAGTALSTLTQPAWSRNLQQALVTASNKSPGELASDEDFWHFIQQSYTVTPSIINLNNGGVAPSPIPVQEAMKRNFDQVNEAPSYYMWRIMDQGREPPCAVTWPALPAATRKKLLFNVMRPRRWRPSFLACPSKRAMRWCYPNRIIPI